MQSNEFQFQIDILRAQTQVKKGDWIILGYATTYDLKEDGLQITREALENAKDDLLTYSTVLFNHNSDRPIGKIVETDVDDVGLLIKMVLSKGEEEIWKKVQDGTINKFSIQGRIVEAEPMGKDSTQLQVTKIKLYEAGLVSVPGDSEAKTISWWVARSLTNQASSNNMKNFIDKLEKIRDKSPDDIKEELGRLIDELKIRSDVISKLQLLAGKAEDGDREALEYAVSILRRDEDGPSKPEEEEKEEEAPEYTLADETEDRPVFQVNVDLSEEDWVEKKKGKNIFRKQILRKGKWYHWGMPGGILEVTDKVISNIVENFKNRVLDHVYVPLSHTNDPARNAGEVVELLETGDGLDAVIEIKDKTIAEKIKEGLIRGISASLDSNYFVSDKRQFVGPTMLHAALVMEPFIKGMSNFIPLSDEYKERLVVQLEDSRPDFYSILELVKETLTTIKNNIVTEDKLKEILSPSKEAKIEESEEPKVGDACKLDDGTEGVYQKGDDEKLVCSPKKAKEDLDEETDEEIEETKDKEEYEKCVSKKVKAGTDLGEAITACKRELNLEESTSEESTGEQPEEKSEEEPTDVPEKVDLSDAEGTYERYLRAGKTIPAQKEAFMQLLALKKVVNLGDGQVDLSKIIDAFLETQPKVVNFEEEGTIGGESLKKEEPEIPEEVQNFYAKMGLSDDVIRESWEYAQTLKKKEDAEKESTLFN